MGNLVGAAQRARQPDHAAGAVRCMVFVLLQVLSPVHQALGANLGSRTAAWLYDRLANALSDRREWAISRNPGLTSDLTMARDFA